MEIFPSQIWESECCSQWKGSRMPKKKNYIEQTNTSACGLHVRYHSSTNCTRNRNKIVIKVNRVKTELFFIPNIKVIVRHWYEKCDRKKSWLTSSSHQVKSFGENIKLEWVCEKFMLTSKILRINDSSLFCNWKLRRKCLATSEIAKEKRNSVCVSCVSAHSTLGLQKREKHSHCFKLNCEHEKI